MRPPGLERGAGVGKVDGGQTETGDGDEGTSERTQRTSTWSTSTHFAG